MGNIEPKGGFRMNNNEVAIKLIELLGTDDNIKSVGNCMTRVRVDVKDTSKAKIKEIKKLDNVIGVVEDNKNIQIIVGPGKSKKIADEILTMVKASSIDYDDTEIRKAENKEKNNTPFKQVLKKVAAVFIPIIPAFIACGLLVALYESGYVFMPGFEETNIGKVMSAMAYSVFTILPIIVGYNTSKEFGGTPIIGAALAAILTSPAITGVELLSITFVAGRGGVISVLVVAALSALFEKRLSKVIPDMFDTFVTPLITIIVMSFVGLLVFQPLGGFVSDTLGNFVNYIIYNVPALSGLATLVYLPLVMTGMHHGLIAVNAALIADFGFTYLLPVTCMAGAGQVGASFYVYLKTKNVNLKNTIKNALPVGMLGIGEPLMWGVTVPLGKPFIASCLGGAIAGSAVAMMGVAAKIPELSGLQLAFITNKPLAYLLGILIAYISGFIICMLLGFNDPVEN